jgi:inner membrane protein
MNASVHGAHVFRGKSKMRAYSHMLLGAATWLLYARLEHAVPGALATGAAVAGSLLPDIDHPQSFIGRRLRLISRPLSRIIGHRGLTHSLLALAGGFWLLLKSAHLNVHVAQALALGYLSHLAGDWLTAAGIPLLWPWRKRFVSPVSFTCGGRAEILLDIVLSIWLGWELVETMDLARHGLLG